MNIDYKILENTRVYVEKALLRASKFVGPDPGTISSLQFCELML